MKKTKDKEKKKKSPDFSKVAARMSRRNVRAPSGRKVLDCGDAISKLLAGHNEKGMCELVQRLVNIVRSYPDENMGKLAEEIEKQKLTSSRTAFNPYRKLNIGMRRMNFGNKLRGCFSRLNVKKELTEEIVEKVLH